MKKNLKKLALNKKAVSSLTSQIRGGFARAGKTSGPLTCTDPTARTLCYICPAQDQER